MPSQVHHHRGYRIAIYSPTDNYAVITPPGSNAVIDFKERQPQSTVVEGPNVCLERAIDLIDSLVPASTRPDHPDHPTRLPS
ncbi:hypothetical protein [Neorhizobium sp. P12A]|uniref:hypothetical protein n=1 Tax=Neorhizobium sp. P12A TaxID=2268027 RepID=UPI0011EBCD6D|nr:hypothetical protein [Neorhizobium sp. P12A]